MGDDKVLTGVKPGITVLIDGTKYQARGLVADGRMFVDLTNGDELYLTGAQQRSMAAAYRLTLDELPKNIEEGIARARAADFATYDVANRTTALRRLQYVRAVYELPPKLRRRKSEIEICIDRVHGSLMEQTTPDFSSWATTEEKSGSPESKAPGLIPDPDADTRRRAEIIQEKLQTLIERDTRANDRAVPVGKKPTARSVRRWYRMYYASGQDIRVLLNHHPNKGNSTPRYPEWAVEQIDRIINENIACPTPSKYSKALQLASEAVEAEAKRLGEPLPTLAASEGGQVLGKNLIARWVGKRNRFELATSQVGIYEARRRFKEVELGPQGERPNHQWEVDHTALDLFVIDEQAQHVHGRPWLTVIMDRYTRCIVGFSLSFAPASWISVSDALRVAIAEKTKLIAHINNAIGDDKYKIKENWACHGIPDWLVTDHGREFKSKSMDQTLAILNTRPIQVKKKKPWLKGKVERWFRTFQEEFVHTIPGTTFSKFEKRKFYKSEEFAVVTLPELNWLVLKWVVDVYNQRPHGKLRISPAEMWSRGIKATVSPRKLPAELMRPTMGIVIDRVLGLNGIRWAGLRWDSTALARLREKFKGTSEVVQIRLDPRDLRKIYAWDEDDEHWVEGRLVEPKEAGNYSLDQWYYIDTRRKELMAAHGMSKKKAVRQAIADIQDFIRTISQNLSNSQAYKRYLVNVHRHHSAWEMLLPENWDSQNDGPPGEHQLGPSAMLPTMQEGPYREREWPPQDGESDETEEIGKPAKAETREENPNPRLLEPPHGDQLLLPPPKPPADDVSRAAKTFGHTRAGSDDFTNSITLAPDPSGADADSPTNEKPETQPEAPAQASDSKLKVYVRKASTRLPPGDRA